MDSWTVLCCSYYHFIIIIITMISRHQRYHVSLGGQPASERQWAEGGLTVSVVLRTRHHYYYYPCN